MTTKSECKKFLSGYFRELERYTGGEYVVPVEIISICLGYLFCITEAERFAECGNHSILFSNGRKTIFTPQAGQWDTAYGTFEINCDRYQEKIFRWTLYIENNGGNCSAIGIDESSRKWTDDIFKNHPETYNYSLTADGKAEGQFQAETTGEGFDAGDTLILELNVKGRTLTYYKYHKVGYVKIGSPTAFICKYQNIKSYYGCYKTYCLAVYLWRKGKVTLTNFEIKSNR